LALFLFFKYQLFNLRPRRKITKTGLLILEEKYEKRRDLLLKIYKASDKNMDRQMTLAEFHHLAGKDKPHKSNLWQEYVKTDNPGRVPSSCRQG
jgi:hypothetical protein